MICRISCRKNIKISFPAVIRTQEKQEIVYFAQYADKRAPGYGGSDKAEEGLISYLKQPGPGVEKAKEKDPFIISLLKSYVTKENYRNIKRERKADGCFEKIPLDIKNRISILAGLIRRKTAILMRTVA